MIHIFDIECFRYDWLVVFKDISTGEYTVIHNDNAAVKRFMTADRLLCGFNSKHYDNHILKAILCGADNALVKEINDYIISGRQGFEHWFIKENKAWFDSFDIRDDMQQGLSLKAIEGHLGLNVEETSVPFDIDRPLTEVELEEVIEYCKHDVDTAEKLVKLRKNYLKCKQMLGEMKGIPAQKALYMTNAKVTAAYLGARKQEWDDGRVYEYPPNLDKDIIPKEVIEFFDTINDTSIPDEKLFKTSLTINIGNCPCKFAWGGVHGSLLCYNEQSTDSRVIQNRDVSSLYPSLIIEYNYLSRNVESPEFFKQTKDIRIKAKHEGDTETANTLKLPLNIVSGATEQSYNDLYDPRQARSMRITGQMFLTELAVKLITACKTFKMLNLNTDGIMYSVDKNELPIVDRICKEWEQNSRFELETDNLKAVWIKDVNNLLSVDVKGKIKTVGGYLNHGIVDNKGAWNINNNAVIVKKAIIDYFVKGIPVEKTITECNDIFEFQFIAKAGTKYKEAYHLVNDEKIPVQKVNRVYASKNPIYGKLHKVKASDDSEAKIESLPDHCIIDNDNKLTIDDVDKQFYIDMAQKRINDFLGIKPEKVRKTRKKKLTKKDWAKFWKEVFEILEGCYE
ncbi:MAG: DNA polymerase elongation subunit (family B) [Candidatus Dehalobacter alkaniphilus]